MSRVLSAESPLRAWAADHAYRLIDRSFLTFVPVSFPDPGPVDWWFFYSPRAVEFALAAGHPRSPRTRLAAMGEGTAAALTARKLNANFVGRGTPREVAAQFAAVAWGTRVFFPRAAQSRRTVQTLLADALTAVDAVCYDNRPVPPEAPVNAHIYVFTSPLNVAAYLDHWALRPRAKVFAIGPSTGAALRERGVRCHWPEEPTEEGLLGLLTGKDGR